MNSPLAASDPGLFLAPALWLPQPSPWTLGALAAVADALLVGGCRVRVYDADFAGGHPLATQLTPSAAGGTWSPPGSAPTLPWWEIPLGATVRGEHVFLWVGEDALPPQGWQPLVSRAYRRQVPYFWLPGSPAFGLPEAPGGQGDELPDPADWLRLTYWNARPTLPRPVLARWRRGVPPGSQARGTGFWWHRQRARRAARDFTEEFGAALAGV